MTCSWISSKLRPMSGSSKYRPLPRGKVDLLDDATTLRSKSGTITKELRGMLDSLRQDLAVYSMPVENDLVAGTRLVSEIGEGTFGVVWRAVDCQSGTDVAVKVFRYERLAVDLALHQFRRGARIMRRLSESREAPETILRLLRSDEADTAFVMEYMPHLDLTSNVDNWNMSARMEVFRIICRAVEFAHSRGVVHRDIRPQNILVRDDGLPVLADFDIADYTFLTKDTRLAPGTYLYAAPEQLACAGDPRNFAVDIFSLGRVLQFLLRGSDPLIGQKQVEGFPEFNDLFAKALSEDPENRPGSIRELLRLIPVSFADGTPRNSRELQSLPNLQQVKGQADVLWSEAQALAKRKFYRPAIKKADQAIPLIQDLDYGRCDDWERERDSWRVAIGERPVSASIQEYLYRFLPRRVALPVGVLAVVVIASSPLLKLVRSSNSDLGPIRAPASTSSGGGASVTTPSANGSRQNILDTALALDVADSGADSATEKTTPAFALVKSEAAMARARAWMRAGLGNHSMVGPVLPLRKGALALDPDQVQIGSFVCHILFDDHGNPAKIDGCEGRGAARTRVPLNLGIRCAAKDDRRSVNCWSGAFQYEINGDRRDGQMSLSLKL